MPQKGTGPIASNSRTLIPLSGFTSEVSGIRGLTRVQQEASLYTLVCTVASRWLRIRSLHHADAAAEKISALALRGSTPASIIPVSGHRAATHRNPSDHAGASSTSCPRRRRASSTADPKLLSILRRLRNKSWGANDPGKCSLLNLGASIAC